ncbi:MAG: LysR family transcriptional regulator [Desulfobacterales bacterium]|nr:LysR family transcriptional regulator [Desulfobacterales bacterium]MCP4159544.1 LysR family transcriptional regulator [Deltaproteobacteria bacterium]
MELRQLKTFQVVGKLLSFNRAADTLNYAQSTVSAQIKSLEDEFGVPLFDRLGKKVLLTEAGKLLMRYAQKMIEIEKETITEVSGWETPNASISARVPQSISNHFLPDILLKLDRKLPGLGFNIISCAYDSLPHELRAGIVDIAFLVTEGINTKNLNAEVLRIVPINMVAAPFHELSQKEFITIEDLEKHTALLPLHDCSYKMTFHKMITEKNIKIKIMEFNSIESIKKCVEKGVGFTIAPDFYVQNEVQKGILKVLPWEGMDIEFSLLMILHKDKWISPHLYEFMKLSRDIIS